MARLCGAASAFAGTVASLLVALSGAAANADDRAYLRIDYGLSMPRAAGITDSGTPPIVCIGGSSGCGGQLNEIGPSAVPGLGLGWRALPWFRVDMAIDYRGWLKLSDQDQFSPPASYTADVTSLTAMGNVYLDLPVEGPYRPYIGTGLGWARNRTDSVRYSQSLGGGLVSTGAIAGGTWSGLVWQVVAGLAITPAPGWMLDLGWRYRDAGEVGWPAGTTTDSLAGTMPVAVANGRLRSNDLMMSIRIGF
jgi:opacity protein-like surface antigen